MQIGGEEGYLLDTNIASGACDYGNPLHDIVRKRLQDLDLSLVFICSITVAEVDYGLKTAPLVDVERQRSVRNAMARYKKLDVDPHTAEAWADIRATLFKKYSPRSSRGRLSAKRIENLREPTTGRELGIQENDLWIVSVAVQYNLIFGTNDRHGGMPRILCAANYLHRTEYLGAI